MQKKLRNKTTLRKITHEETMVSRSEGAKIYAELKQQVTKARILKRSYGYYAVLMTIVLTGYSYTFFKMYTAAHFPLIIFWGFILSLFAVQMGGLMHDAGHRTIAKSTKMNDFFGHLFAIPLAMPFGDWRTTHNMHHAHPNEEEEDPDIELPFISLTENRYRAQKGIAKLLRPYQAFLWYPFGTLVAFTKRFYGYKYFKKQWSKKIIWQLPFYILGVFIWFFLPFFLFPFLRALTIVLTSNLVTGFFLANIFAPNHKGMPLIKKGEKISFIEQQIITARNIKGGFLTDTFYMGLNYQIEHHLFPNTPRNKLRQITPFAKKIAKHMHWDFTVVTVQESNRIIFNELQHIVDTVDGKRRTR